MNDTWMGSVGQRRSDDRLGEGNRKRNHAGLMCGSRSSDDAGTLSRRGELLEAGKWPWADWPTGGDYGAASRALVI